MTASEALGLVARVNLALAAGVVLVMLLRLPARKALGARAAYGLWLLPLAAAAAVLIPARTALPGHGRIFIGEARLASGAAPASASIDLTGAALWVWLGGAAAFALYVAFQQRRFLNRARRGEAGPAVLGLVKPLVVLPADFEARFIPLEREAVIAHERAHIAAHHPRINAAIAAAQAAFWFNPFVHLSAHLSRIDQELACDATVIAKTPALRRIYAETLLKTQLAATPLPLGCYWPARSEHPLTERIAMLARPTPARATRLAAAAMVSAAAGAVALSAWAAQPARIATPAASSDGIAAPAPSSAPAAASAPVVNSERKVEVGQTRTVEVRRIAQASHVVTQPDWLSRPGVDELVRFYPAEALKASLPGMARMECTVMGDGKLADCYIGDETPSGAGFGQAALELAPYFQMKPMSRDGQPVAGGKVVIPIRFAIN